MIKHAAFHVALARVVAATPASYVLPPLVGGVGTMNLFVALVGPSGSGKGAAHSAAEEALDLSGFRDPISRVDHLVISNVGSGEGIGAPMTSSSISSGCSRAGPPASDVTLIGGDLRTIGTAIPITVSPGSHKAR